MRLFTNPYTGSVRDFDTYPQHSNQTNKPGRWCPETNMPLDDVALANMDLSGMLTLEARNAMYQSAKEKVDAIKADLVSPSGVNARVNTGPAVSPA